MPTAIDINPNQLSSRIHHTTYLSLYRIFYKPSSKQGVVLFGMVEADLMMDCSMYRQTIVIKYSTITTIHSYLKLTLIIHINYYLLFFLIVIVIIIITVILFLICF